MRNTLLEKRNNIEAMLTIFTLTKVDSMKMMNDYIVDQLASSEYQGAVPFITKRITRDFGIDFNRDEGEVFELDDALNNYFLTKREFEKVKKNIKKNLKEENLKGIKEEYIESFDKKYHDLLYKKGLNHEKVKRRALFRSDEWSRLLNEGDFSLDKYFRLYFAMELTPAEACELASASKHPIRMSSKREIILFFCLEQKVYDFDDVNEILNSFGEYTPLSGTVES